MNKCTAVIGSMTIALKAQKILHASSIRSTVVKLDSSATQRGCAYGLEFDCNQYSNIRYLLEKSHVNVTRYLTGGDSM